MIFSNHHYLDDAGAICHYLLKHDGNTDKQPELLLSVVNGFKKENKQDQYLQYKELLKKDFPDSKQARIVASY